LGKIAASHLERKACVYVRQSSMAQVQHHRESTQRQYSFRERAITLGWRAEQVEVIDEDQGQSGASAGGRGGFQRLVLAVGMGEVGAILGLEVSRLARSCADWYRLLEIAAVARTLIMDEDGVYDPNQYNDRLVLGLKGTFSEAELHFLKQRMVGGRRNKAEHGAFRIRLPAGYVWEQGDGIRMDPDERVRDAVGLFFRSFDRIGTAMGVARYFEDNGQPFPCRDGWGSLESAVTWGGLSVSRAVAIMRNPIYAGAYAYNRHCQEEVDREEPGAGGRIVIRDAHPGYISWEQYERNVSRLVENRDVYGGMRRKGSAREGSSLLQGIVLCGLCGRHMQVHYGSDGRTMYSCYTPMTRRVCQEVHGRYVEPLVEEELLKALNQEELELAIRAMEKLEERAEELDRQWRKRLEGARYEAEKAARRYHQVEPENRLVVRTLEKEWNERLEEAQRLEKEYQEARQKPPCKLSGEQREKILSLAQDIPRLWKAPTTRNSQRKQLLRLLIEDVTLRNVDDSWSTEVAIHWKTGAVSRHMARRVVPHPQTTAPEVVTRIREIYQEKTDLEIAQILNAEGYKSGYGKPFTVGGVAHLRERGGIKKRILKDEDE